MSTTLWEQLLSLSDGFKRQTLPLSYSNGERLALTEPVCYPLNHLGLIEVIGPDRIDFLQGQLSCNMKALTESSAPQLATYCNLKGQILASMYAKVLEDRVWLQLHRGLIATVIEKLQFYGRFSKITIQDISDQWLGMGFHPAPPSTSHPSAVVWDRSHSVKSWETYTQDIQVIASWCQSIRTMPYSCWQWLNLEQQLVFIEPATSESLTPHQINYHLHGGIDVEKGCYLGQEIIARVHFKTKPRNRLARFVVTGIQAQTGDVVTIDQKKMGTVVSVVSLPGSQQLMMIESKAIDALTNSLDFVIGGQPSGQIQCY